MVSKLVRPGFVRVSLLKIYGFLVDELSKQTKSQFQENHLGVVRRSLRFGFWGQACLCGARRQAAGTVFRVCTVAVVFCPGASGCLRGSNSPST
ncbi:hypothetical protein IH879_11350 [candidate division KSB1 bacterium]|nr:hypothetical protein [candidate division KSB1 bacterium]